MSKIKLVDFDPGEPYETDFGSCELCMSTGIAQEPKFKFEYEDGTKEWVDGYFWSWGDFWAVDIDNTAAFAGWLIKQDFRPDFRINDFWLFRSIINDYHDSEDGELLSGDYYL